MSVVSVNDIGVDVVGINIPALVIDPTTSVAKREGPIKVSLEISEPERPVNAFAQMNETAVAKKPTDAEIAMKIGLIVVAAIAKHTKYQLETCRAIREAGEILEHKSPEEREKLLNPE